MDTHTCKFCGDQTDIDPVDQTAPADYCDHGGANRRVMVSQMKRGGYYVLVYPAGVKRKPRRVYLIEWTAGGFMRVTDERKREIILDPARYAYAIKAATP